MQFWYNGHAIERLGQRYRLEGHLGSGGMAQVCLAWDERELRRVAVKILQANDLDQETLNRFMKEAGQIVHWRHPHILRVYDTMQIELLDPPRGSPLFYFVMEYASGGDLHKRLAPGNPFPLSATFTLFRQLCDAVQFAHERGVIHRDLKPLNILFRRPAAGPEEVVLSDFGLAVQADASHYTFARGGTLAYMAPEQFVGEISPACDIFALGVILYQLCTGRLPFRRALQNLPPPRDTPLPVGPSLLNPDFPPELDEPVLHALHGLPSRRYSSAHAFWRAIEQTLAAIAQTSPFLSRESWLQTGQTWPFESGGEGGREQVSLRHSVPEEEASAGEPDEPWSEADQRETRSRVPRRASALVSRGEPPEAITFRSPDTLSGRRALSISHAGPRSTRVSLFAQRPALVGRPSRVRRSARPFVLGALVLLLTALLLATTLPASPFRLFGVSPTILTITPRARLEQNTYRFTAVTTTPDPAARQVQARLLSITTPARSATAPATGSLPPARATGQLTFINNTANAIVVQSGIVTGNSGVPISFTGPITIPAIPPTVVVNGTAVNPGAAGNLPAFDIDKPCCVSGVVVKNTQAFTGGHDAESVVQQSDIAGAAGGLSETLTHSGQAGLQRMVRNNERVVDGSQQCRPDISADQRAGEVARTVVVTVVVTCGAETYDYRAVVQAAGSLLRAQAAGDSNLGSAYALAGAPAVNVRSAGVLQPQGEVGLEVQARGQWAYRFSPALLRQLASRLAGKTRSEALDLLLHQPGIVAVQFSSDATLPASSDHIQLLVGHPASTA